MLSSKHNKQFFFTFLLLNPFPPARSFDKKRPTTRDRGPPGPGSGAGSGTGALPGQGNHLLNRRTRGGGGGPSEAEGEFDFEAGLAKFDKEKVG